MPHFGELNLEAIRDILVPEQQPDAAHAEAPPTANTLYTILDTTRNVRIISACVFCVWTVQPDPLELIITIDGQTIIHGFNDPVSATWYHAIREGHLDWDVQSLTVTNPAERSFLLEGRSVKIEMRIGRITPGTVSTLSGIVKYAKW